MVGFLIGFWGSLGASSPPHPLPFSFSIIELFSLLASPLQTALLPLLGKMLTYTPTVLTHQSSSSHGGNNFFIQGPGHQSQRRMVTGSARANLRGQGDSNGTDRGHLRVCTRWRNGCWGMQSKGPHQLEEEGVSDSRKRGERMPANNHIVCR